MEASKSKEQNSTARLVWQRAGTGRAKELKGTAPTPTVVGPPCREGQPLALHTHSYTYVFNRLTHHTHRTHLQRAFCAGLYGAPPAEPNTAFYTELDERLRLQTRTLTALRTKLAVESGAGASWAEGEVGTEGEGVDTVAMRRAVNSSLSQQLEFFTRCMERYCGRRLGACSCCATQCSCGCGWAGGGTSGGDLHQ